VWTTTLPILVCNNRTITSLNGSSRQPRRRRK
jgi:hypothetical protein